jgi:hypothetical protein
MSSILKINNFEQTNLSIAAPKALGNMGAKVVSLNYKFAEGQAPITLQTPWLRSYGINKWVDPANESAPPKLSVTLSFLGHETDPKITEFKEFLETLDEWAIDLAHKNSWEWLKSKSVPRDTVAFNYTRSLKVPVDKETGEPNGKPANMKLKLTHTDATGYSASFFTKEKNVLSTEEVESYFTMGSKVRGLIQCTGFWIAAGKFGLSWKLKQMVVEPSTKIGKEYAFDDEEAVEDDVPPKQAPVTKQPVLQVVDSDHEADVGEEQVVKAEAEPEPAQVKKVVRKVITKK